MKNSKNLFQKSNGILENMKSIYKKFVKRLDQEFSVFNSKDFQIIQGKNDHLLEIFDNKIGHFN
jgi:hypothetical protein